MRVTPRLSRSMLLVQWETRGSRMLHALGMDSVRTAILTLAIVAALIPALATGCISYRQNRRAIDDKLREQLAGLSGQAAREVDLWFKEGIYNLRVFAASYEVTENVGRGTPQGRARLGDYLGSVRERFPDYDELLVVAPDRRIVASSERRGGPLHFAGDWLAPARAGDPVLGEPFTAEGSGQAAMELAVPIMGPTGRFLGVLAARLNFRGAGRLLEEVVTGRRTRLMLLAHDGRPIAAADSAARAMSAAALARLERAEGVPLRYAGPDGTGLVGALAPIHRTSWSVVAYLPQALAFAEITRLRNATISLVLLLVVIAGSLAYALGLLIVRPLSRLSRAARRVAGGDLDVAVPSVGGGELSELSDVFNDMVRRLREAHVELEQLSVTDPLTGLANRRRLMGELEREVVRSDRQKHRFAVVMLDVDHFKRYNDTHGHLAGDEVLKRMGSTLREMVREVDTAARFGGEEFLVVLPETPVGEAARVAERIRERVAQERFSINGGDPAGVTVSIGLAAFPADAATPDALIAAADQALYRAKEGGRNRVVVAGERR